MAEDASKKQWVLREELASKRLKRPIYYWRWTGLGPMSTDKLEDAQRFDSKREAMMHPAYIHALSFYEPEEL